MVKSKQGMSTEGSRSQGASELMFQAIGTLTKTHREYKAY